MSSFEPTDAFRQVLTQLDVGGADAIVTPEADAARWARPAGYAVSSGARLQCQR